MRKHHPLAPFTALMLTLSVCWVMAVPAAAQVGGSEPVYFDGVGSDGSVHGSYSLAPVQTTACTLCTVTNPMVHTLETPVVVRDSGPSANRVDLLFLADGYTQNDINSFAGSVASLSTGVFVQAPFYEFSNYFNVHRLDLLSAESGVANDPTNGTARNTVLDSQFWCQGTADNICTNVADAWSYAAQARDADQIIVLANSATAGGAAYPFSDLAVLSARQPYATDNLLHQLGHSFGNLADESDTGVWPTYTGFEPAEPNVSPQTAASMTAQQIKWYRWLGVDLGPSYGGVIGTYEGAMGHLYGIYRPTQNSKMRTVTAPFNGPSIEGLIKQIYTIVSPIDEATAPSPSLTGLDTLSVKPMQPIGRNLDVQWYVGGQAIAGATGKTFRPNDYPIADGTYTVSVTVADNTSFMKDEAFRTSRMIASRSWSVAIDENPPVIVTPPVSRTVNVGQTANFSVVATGDALRYQWYKNGTAITGATAAAYTTPAAAHADSGSLYTVAVSNVAGSITTAAATLTVLNRAPVILAASSLMMSRSQSRSISVPVTDQDGDAVVLTAVIDPASGTTGATISLTGTTLTVNTGATFLGSFNVLFTATDRIDTAQATMVVTVSNQLPSISPIAGQLMKWRQDSVTVPVQANDLDNDTLSYSAQLESPAGTPVTFAFQGANLIVNPQDGYIGNFTVRVSVSDGRGSASTTFPVTVYNTPPVLNPILNQFMHYKTDFITVPLVASDADGDPLTLTASFPPGESAPVALSISGSTLTINPITNYIGTFNVKVSTSDTKQTVSQTFRVDVRNNAPVIQPILDRQMHYKTPSISVPVSATDPDGEQVTLSATLSPGEVAPVQLSFQGTNLIVDPAADYLGTFHVTVRAVDASSYTEAVFGVTVYNRAPIFTAIPDQRMHWLKEDSRTISLNASDADGETLTYTAELIGTLNPAPVLTLTGNQLNINPPDRFLGSFILRVTASDGMLSDVRTFSVTTYNTAPDLQPICDRSVAWNRLPLTVTLQASDADNETLTYSAAVEDSFAPYRLDQIYNFSRTNPSWQFNVRGLNEKYLQGDKNQAGAKFTFALLPNGDLYEWKTSLASSTLIASLPTAFYQDPTMLIDVPDPTGSSAGVTVSTTGNVLSLNAPSNYRGTVLVRARASDGQLFDEESFLTTVYDGKLYVNTIDPVIMHWRETSRTVTLNTTDPDGNPLGSAVTYTAQFADTTLAYTLDQQYRFFYNFYSYSPLLHYPDYDNGRVYAYWYPVDNAAGRGEKYVPSGYGGQNRLFALLPDGSLYLYNVVSGAMPVAGIFSDSSYTFIAQLPVPYYSDPSLLYMVQSPSAPVPVTLSVSGNQLTITPERGYTGGMPITVTASDGSAQDSTTFLLSVFNDVPLIDLNPHDQTRPVVPTASGNGAWFGASWKSNSITIPIQTTDPNAPDRPFLAVAAALTNMNHTIRVLDQQYNFTIDSPTFHYGEYGLHERRIIGYVNGVSTPFIILPTGDLYQWGGSLSQSTYITTLEKANYAIPASLVDSENKAADSLLAPAGATVTASTSAVTVTWPAGYTGSFTVQLVASDGNYHFPYQLGIAVTDSPPVIGLINPIRMHWRTTATAPLSISEPDGEPMQIGALDHAPGYPADSYRHPLSAWITGSTLNLKPDFGATGTYPVYVVATTNPAGVPWTNDRSTSYRSVAVTMFNTAPTLTAIGAKQTGYKAPLAIPLTFSDADAPDQGYLVAKAWLGTDADQTARLSQQYSLTADPAGLQTNALGLGEQHIRGTVGGVSTRIVLLGTGALYTLDATDKLTTLLGYTATANWSAPTALFGLTPTARPSVGLSVAGGTLTINPASANYIGAVPVTVEIGDGLNRAWETFTLTLTNTAPAITTLPDIRRHFRQPAFTVTAAATDADSDTVTYSAAITASSSPNPAQLSIAGSQITLTPTTNWTGTYTVTVTASDGRLSTSKAFNVTIYDNAPVITPVANVTLGYKQSFSTTLAATDPDSDPLTYTFAAAPANASQINVAATGSTVTVSPKTPFVGTATVNATVSDGLLATQSSFTITYQNRAPAFAAIPSQTIKWAERSRTITVSATDPDNDPLTYSAVAGDPNAATVTMSGQQLTITPRILLDSLPITVTASDGTNRTNYTFLVFVTNRAPTLSPIPNQTVPWSTNSIALPITTSDADGETPQLSARIIGSAYPATLSIANSTLTIALTGHQVGSFSVEVQASDLLVAAATTFSVTVTNGAPVLEPVADQVIGYRVPNTRVTLVASDPDNDPLTYSARVLSEADLVYELDQLYNFALLAPDYAFNKLNNAEKYIKGVLPGTSTVTTFVVYPNGRFYIWSGQLTTSTYLATLPSAYYTNPSLLFDAAAVAAHPAVAQVSVSGATVTITPNNENVGKFWIRAEVTDTRDIARAFFGVSVQPVASDTSGDGEDDGSDNSCSRSEHSYDGDYHSCGQRKVSIEGRIGRRQYGGTSGYELGCSRGDGTGFANGESGRYTWQSGTRVPFLITYDKEHSVIKLSMNGTVVSHAVDASLTLSDAFIHTNSRYDADSIVVDQLKLNGVAIGSTCGSSKSRGRTSTLQLRTGALNDKFTLEGSVTMNFGSNSRQLAKDDDLGFDISFETIEGHKTNCDDNGDRKVTICHMPEGNPFNGHTIRISRNALETHLSHGDVIGECPGSPSDPGDGSGNGGTCEQKKIIASPNYTVWNSFLNMMNILELVNPGETDLPVTISFYSINGELKHQRTVVVPAINQFDVIVNDFPGFVKDSYGVIKLEFSGPLDGRLMYYRASNDGKGYDFAFDIPFNDASFGTTAVSFNTNQPSIKPEERDNIVTNWLSIVNLDSQPQSYTVLTYNSAGTLLLRRRIDVAPFGRADVDGGHELAGPGVVGSHVIIPDNVTAEYFAMLSRYGGDAPAGYAPSKFKFAFPLVARLGQSDPIYAPISNKFDEFNWVEVVNILDKPVEVTVNFYARDGQLLESLGASLDPHAQFHFNASSYLGTHETGYTEIIPHEAFSIIAQSMGYLRDLKANSVTAAYGTPARRALPCLQSGSYNLYLSMQDWLLVANTTNAPMALTIRVTGPNLVSEKTLTLASRASVFLPIHDPVQFGAKKDTYGGVSVIPTDPTQRPYAEVTRVRYRADGTPDFAAPTPIR